MDANEEFDRVYGLYFKSVYSYFSLCFSQSDAEDCSQQVFLNVWKSMKKPGGRGPENWKAWVFRLAVNVKNDRFREKYSSRDVEELPGETAFGAAEPDMAHKLAVEQAFKRLTHDERDVLLLKNNGFTSDEIGKLLKISASAVRSRLSAARVRFKGYLNDCGVNVDG